MSHAVALMTIKERKGHMVNANTHYFQVSPTLASNFVEPRPVGYRFHLLGIHGVVFPMGKVEVRLVRLGR